MSKFDRSNPPLSPPSNPDDVSESETTSSALTAEQNQPMDETSAELSEAIMAPADSESGDSAAAMAYADLAEFSDQMLNRAANSSQADAFAPFDDNDPSTELPADLSLSELCIIRGSQMEKMAEEMTAMLKSMATTNATQAAAMLAATNELTRSIAQLAGAVQTQRDAAPISRKFPDWTQGLQDRLHRPQRGGLPPAFSQLGMLIRTGTWKQVEEEYNRTSNGQPMPADVRDQIAAIRERFGLDGPPELNVVFPFKETKQQQPFGLTKEMMLSQLRASLKRHGLPGGDPPLDPISAAAAEAAAAAEPAVTSEEGEALPPKPPKKPPSPLN